MRTCSQCQSTRNDAGRSADPSKGVDAVNSANQDRSVDVVGARRREKDDRVSDLVTKGSNAREGTAATVEFGPHPSQYYLHTAPWSARSARCSFASLSRSTHREQATEPILAVFEHLEIHVRCTGLTIVVLERVIEVPNQRQRVEE
jgi:hypothetical protein